MIFRGILNGSHHIGRNGICKLQGAILECIVNCCVISAQHEVDLCHGNLVSCPVVGVGLIGHGLVMLPLGQYERAAAYEPSFQCPCTGVGVSAVSSFYSLLRYRIKSRECAQVKEICAGCVQMSSKGLAVFACFDIQSAVILSCKYGAQVRIVSSCVFICQTVPAIQNVICIQSFAVRPL